MGQQIIICVEADKRSKTDWVYLKDLIQQFYQLPNTVSLHPIYMGGKTNYKRNQVISEIKRRAKAFRQSGPTHVVYCIDTDAWDIDPDWQREFLEIRAYCEQQGYDFGWFCRDIEEVFWGEPCVASEKLDKARKFRSQRRIESISATDLSASEPRRGKSNILKVLDQFLERRTR